MLRRLTSLLRERETPVVFLVTSDANQQRTKEEGMMKRATLMLASLALLLGSLGQAKADLVGTSVTGSLTFAQFDGSTNYYSPVNGDVPSGYLNHSGTTVTISNTAVEFGFSGSAATITASSAATITSDFTSSQLTITYSELNTGFFPGSQFSFTDTAFEGLTLTKLSDTFDNGGLTGSLSRNTLSLNWAGSLGELGNTMSAVFSVSNVPEPSGFTLLGLGVVCLAAGYVVRRRTLAQA